jgi:hypothetical protein
MITYCTVARPVVSPGVSGVGSRDPNADPPAPYQEDQDLDDPNHPTTSGHTLSYFQGPTNVWMDWVSR